MQLQRSSTRSQDDNSSDSQPRFYPSPNNPVGETPIEFLNTTLCPPECPVLKPIPSDAMFS
eukprot:4650861-Prorocentrum_lima.AAC.1